MEKISLDVPYFAQPHSSPYCGAAAAKMVLAKHGREAELNRLVREIGITHKRGAMLPDLGAWFCENGFDVTVVACPKELPPQWAYEESWAVLSKKLHGWSRREVPKERFARRAMQRFLAAGGKFEYRPVQWPDIARALNDGEPPILNVTMSSYYPTRTWDAGHYVVPVVIDDNVLGFHDSIMGPTIHLPRERALYVCHIRHGGAVFIRPKKSE